MKNWRNLLELTILFAFAVYVVILYATGKVTFFIHPRYVTFTYVFALFAALVSAAGVILWFEKQRESGGKKDSKSAHVHLHHGHDHDHDHEKPELGFWGKLRSEAGKYGLLVGVVVLAFVLPVKPLSVATAQQREIDFNSLNFSDAGALDSFFRDSDRYSLGDWVTSLNYDPNPANYVGKAVRVSGFAYKSENLPQGTFRLARFVITCCAVDARPVGLIVQNDNVQENQWYEVTGEFALLEGSEDLIIIPTETKSIDEPKDPYIF